MVTTDILVNGNPVKKHFHNGQTFVQANKNSFYSIRLRNNTSVRKLFVCTVDGINVLDESAGGTSNAGYVINAWSSYELKGFRTSNDSVNLFRFSEKEQSYAAKSSNTGGDTSNCGVIGIKVFDPEVTFVGFNSVTPFISPTLYRSNIPFGGNLLMDDTTAGMLGSSGLPGLPGERGEYGTICSTSCSTEKTSYSMGTEFSKYSVTDKVQDIEFNIGALVSTEEIFYASKLDLMEMGVEIEKRTYVRPNAFPSKFCKPPQ